MNPGRLVMPALRWRAETGFGHEEPAIAAALEAGAGGFIVFGGTTESVGALIERLEREAGRPLLIGADLERGTGQQVTGEPELPPPGALATFGEPEVARAAGEQTAATARALGIGWLFAPVADLDVEPANPIVQTRSFGADPARVAELVAAWVTGARAGGALSCVKHFPGHGRTVHDSHDRMPSVAAPLETLEATDLVPFRAGIAAGADAVMTAHVSFPALDPTGTPATRSAPIVGYLRDRLGFEGMVVTDALIMEGFAGGLGAVPAAVAAVRAGIDVLLYPPDPVATAAGLVRAAAGDLGLARRIAEAEGRYHRALNSLGRLPRSEPDRGLGARLAARLVAGGAPTVRLRAPLELVVADDDQDGAFPPSPNDWLEAALRRAEVPLGPGGSRVLVAFAEPRASKGRAGFGPRCREIFAGAGAGAAAAVLFGHPRLATELPAGVPVCPAWHRQRLMQEAAAEWLRRAVG